MTEQEQRIVLAEWANLQLSHDKTLYCPHGLDIRNQSNYIPIPYYHNDLNAVHELEKKLSYTQCFDYEATLKEVMLKDFSPKVGVAPNYKFIWNATASQRCEALLRTIGKWKG